jgi:hypothetical protein
MAVLIKNMESIERGVDHPSRPFDSNYKSWQKSVFSPSRLNTEMALSPIEKAFGLSLADLRPFYGANSRDNN